MLKKVIKLENNYCSQQIFLNYPNLMVSSRLLNSSLVFNDGWISLIYKASSVIKKSMLLVVDLRTLRCCVVG